MKVDRSINCVNECEPWRKYTYSFARNMTTGWRCVSNSGTGIIFAPYVPHVFSINNLYPNIIKPFTLYTEKDEIKTQIRYRQFKRFRAARR